MKLEYIQVENFKQFYGKQQADFSTSDKSNVTVFHGPNGAGKTSLFSAINWCLYRDHGDELGDIINRQTMAESKDGDFVVAEVAVAFINEGERHIAKRTLRVRKSAGKSSKGREDMSLARVSAKGDFEKIPNSIGHMNAILHENVRPYFFFDGEKLDDLTKADSTEVEEAIRNIIRLPAIERAELHLGQIAGSYRKQLKKKASAELEELISKEDGLRAEKEQSRERLAELKKEVKLARSHVEDYENRLRDTEEARHLQHQRDQMTDQLAGLEELQTDVATKLQHHANRAYVSFAGPQVDAALAAVDEKRERGEIPSGIRDQFLRDLLEEEKCICGRPFNEHDEVFQNLTKLLQSTTPAGLEADIMDLGANLRRLTTDSSEWLASIDELMGERANIREGMERSHAELDNVKRELKGMPTEKIAELEKQRASFQRDLEMNLQDSGRLEERLSELDRQIEKTRGLIQKEQGRQEKLAQLARKEYLAQSAADAVSLIKLEFIEQTRREVQSVTKEVFDSLAWKEEQFQDILIGEDFRMEVIDRWGSPTRRELSAGERQILSLSFICAMAKISGEVSPLVMDTPFGRLSGNHLDLVAKNLPGLARQLILFVTDREWDKASSTRIQPKIGAEYELAFDQKTGFTKIKEMD